MPNNMPIFTETQTLMSDGSTVTFVHAVDASGFSHGGVYTSPDQRDALIAQLTERITATVESVGLVPLETSLLVTPGMPAKYLGIVGVSGELKGLPEAYTNADGSKWREYQSPEQVFSQASIEPKTKE